MRIFSELSQLIEAVGEELGSSDWIEITQERVDMFAEATGDHQWIHVDVERAKEGPFGTTVAHGYLTLAMVLGFIPEIYQIDLNRPRLNYGVNKVRFPSPVRVGSRVRGRVRLASVNELPAGIQVTFNWTVEIEGHDKPGCVAETVTLLPA